MKKAENKTLSFIAAATVFLACTTATAEESTEDIKARVAKPVNWAKSRETQVSQALAIIESNEIDAGQCESALKVYEFKQLPQEYREACIKSLEARLPGSRQKQAMDRLLEIANSGGPIEASQMKSSLASLKATQKSMVFINERLLNR